MLTIVKRSSVFFLLLAWLVTVPVLAAEPTIEDMVGGTYYLGCNLHFSPTSKGRIWADAAMKTPGGEFIPVGSAVRVHMVKSNKRTGKADVVFVLVESGKRYRYTVGEQVVGVAPALRNIARVFVADPALVQVRLNGLTEPDRNGVKAGRVVAGMSREGVLLAIGYPPEFVDPEGMHAACWRYWRDETKIFEVCFDEAGRVTEVR